MTEVQPIPVQPSAPSTADRERERAEHLATCKGCTRCGVPDVSELYPVSGQHSVTQQ